MACPSCNYQGFIESQTMRDGGLKTVVNQCQTCRDTDAYSAEVQRRLGYNYQRPQPIREMAKVIPMYFFRRRVDD